MTSTLTTPTLVIWGGCDYVLPAHQAQAAVDAAVQNEQFFHWLVDGQATVLAVRPLLPHEEGFDLRWFSPVAEVDLCGHATLASAHVLWESGRLRTDSTNEDTSVRPAWRAIGRSRASTMYSLPGWRTIALSLCTSWRT